MMKNTKRLALRGEVTHGEVFWRFPKARILKMRSLNNVDPVPDADLTIKDYARRIKYARPGETVKWVLDDSKLSTESWAIR